MKRNAPLLFFWIVVLLGLYFPINAKSENDSITTPTKSSIAKSARVSVSAQVHRPVTIGESVTIRENAVIWENALIEDNVMIADNVWLAKNVTIRSSARISSGTRLQRNVEIRRGATIGVNSSVGDFSIIDTGVLLPPNSSIPACFIISNSDKKLQIRFRMEVALIDECAEEIATHWLVIEDKMPNLAAIREKEKEVRQLIQAGKSDPIAEERATKLSECGFYTKGFHSASKCLEKSPRKVEQH